MQCSIGVPSKESVVSIDMDLLRAASRVMRLYFVGLFKAAEDLLEFRGAGSGLTPTKKFVRRDWD